MGKQRSEFRVGAHWPAMPTPGSECRADWRHSISSPFQALNELSWDRASALRPIPLYACAGIEGSTGSQKVRVGLFVSLRTDSMRSSSLRFDSCTEGSVDSDSCLLLFRKVINTEFRRLPFRFCIAFVLLLGGILGSEDRARCDLQLLIESRS